MTRILLPIVATLLIAAAPASTTRPAHNDLVTAGLDADGALKLNTGRSAILKTTRPYKRVAVADPEVVVAKAVGESSLLLTPKRAGSTQVILWDDNDDTQLLDVLVAADLATLKDQLKTLFPEAKIEVSAANGSLVLAGRVPNARVAEQAVAVAAPYSQKVLNLLEVSGGRQVMLQVRFAEISRSAKNALGFNAFAADGTTTFGIGRGPGASPVGAVAQNNNFTLNNGIAVFGGGKVGSFAVEAFVEALRQNNLVRILAEPNLVATSGEDAEFLAGGEFPIPVPQAGGAGGGATAITIEYREFGVKLKFTPVVLGDGKIRLKVAPEVSDLDFTTAVNFPGFVVPGLTQRKVQTTIELAEGQTFAIAGLLNQNVTATKDVTPLLGDVPVLGSLFRSVRYQRKETELVVLVTPRLVEPFNPDQVPAVPGEHWRHPTDVDFHLNGDLGGPIAPNRRPTTRPHTGPAPRFYGQYGFQPIQKSGTPQER